MSKMSWFSLESIGNWGVPVEVDGVGLKFHQAMVMVGMVEDLIYDAKFTKEDAVEHALAAFKIMYELTGGEWQAKRIIRLKGHGVSVRSKFHKQDQRERVMARVRADIAERRERRRLALEILDEAGRRNSGKDKTAIDGALGSLFDVLTKADQETALKSLGKKLGRNIRFRKEQP